MCSGARPSDAGGGQLLTFGCIDHETVQCTYNANAAGGNYAAAIAAFNDCRTASEGVAGYCRSELTEARGLSNQDACGGPNTNIGFHTLIPFVASCEGMYHFRFHADYGYGGFLGVDGVTHSAGDIWGHVFAEDVQLSEGDHYWEATKAVEIRNFEGGNATGITAEKPLLGDHCWEATGKPLEIRNFENGNATGIIAGKPLLGDHC